MFESVKKITRKISILYLKELKYSKGIIFSEIRVGTIVLSKRQGKRLCISIESIVQKDVRIVSATMCWMRDFDWAFHVQPERFENHYSLSLNWGVEWRI